MFSEDFCDKAAGFLRQPVEPSATAAWETPSTALEPDALAASIRKELTAIDRDIPIYGIRPMREYVSQRLEQPIAKGLRLANP